jgi:hypothetical protein|tara:strand:- start:48 stop:488 length:441 start_codon:yes stop_codon:yes gene_type:complete
MIREATVENAPEINAIINDDSCLPWITPGECTLLDCTDAMQDADNLFLVDGDIAFTFRRTQPGIYEVHVMALPVARGRGALKAASDALKWVFEKTDAQIILGSIFVENKAARSYSRLMGFDIAGEASGSEVSFLTKAAWKKESECL